MREMIQMCGWISLIHSEEALLLAYRLPKATITMASSRTLQTSFDRLNESILTSLLDMPIARQ
jgi:hypothetical protein